MDEETEIMSNFAKGSWDIHVHAAPDIFPRWGTAWELAEVCQKAGMAGFVFKYHHGSTVEIASILQDHFPQLKIYGGTTLNYFVGGLNPYAVQTALQLGGKMIWLPTLHAANHGEQVAPLGGFGTQNSDQLNPDKGITILDEHNELVEPMKQILSMLHTKPVGLSTGHLGYEEIVKLVEYIEKNDLKIRLLIAHVSFKAPALTIEQLQDLVKDWIWFEDSYVSISSLPHLQSSSAERIAANIKALPDAQWILSTDSGQVNNLQSPEALEEFAKQLQKQGVSEKMLEQMLRNEPANFLS